MKKIEKNVTISSLAQEVRTGFKEMRTGFAEVKADILKVRAEAKSDILKVRVEAKSDNESLAIMVAKGFDAVDKRLKNLENGQEDIILRLDNTALKFEVVELKRRVGALEKKVR